MKIQKVILYEIKWKWSQAKDVLIIWKKTAPTLPNAFNEDLSLFCDLGNVGIGLLGVYAIPKGQSSLQVEQTTKEVKSLGRDLIIEEATTYAEVC